MNYTDGYTDKDLELMAKVYEHAFLGDPEAARKADALDSIADEFEDFSPDLLVYGV